MTRFVLTATRIFANPKVPLAASSLKSVGNKICGSLALALALTICAPMSQAQSTVVDVPFAFSLQKGKMPAGSYNIRPVSSQVLLIRNLKTGESRFVIAGVRVQAPQVQSPKLVFHKYGNQYFLRQIWNGSDIQGIEIPTSSAEKELNLASTKSPGGSKTVVVAMK